MLGTPITVTLAVALTGESNSKSPFDLIAIPICAYRNSASALLIQCKHGAKISKKEKDKIVTLDVTFTDTVCSIVAWSKAHGQIEFEIYDYETEQWIKMGWL